MDEGKKIMVSLIVIFLLLGMGAYFVVSYNRAKISEQYFNYNGFNFKREGNGYKVEIFLNDEKTPKYFNVRSNPKDIENIKATKDIEELKSKGEIYAVIDPYANLTGVTTMAVLELENIIENQFLFNVQLKAGFTRQYGQSNITVLSCDDATEYTGIILLRLGEENKIIKENGCFVIEGISEYDLINGANRITLTLLGIMKY